MTDASATAIPRCPTALVVDDDEAARSLFRRLLQSQGYEVEMAHDGASALTMVATKAPDVVLLDVRMSGGLDGFEVCRRLRSDVASRLIPIIIVTGLHQREERLRGIEAGADDFLTKPVDNDELLARVRSLIRVKQYTDDLDSAASILMTLSSMIEARDGHSDGHCYRIANLATRLGGALGLGDADRQALYRGGFLHDIGMLAIPDAVLRKAGPLEPEEYELVKSHAIVGDELCGNLRSLRAVRPIVRYHHERLDGSGYPDGLRGDELPLLAQIVGVVDVYEALTTRAPYQNAHSVDEAIDVLHAQVGRGWRRRDVVAALASIVR
jgi:putative two-component system response regulator